MRWTMCRHTFPLCKNEAIVTPSIMTFHPDQKRERLFILFQIYLRSALGLSPIWYNWGVRDLFCSPPPEGHWDALATPYVRHKSPHVMLLSQWHHCAPISVTIQLVSLKLCLTLRKVIFLKGQREANILVTSQLKHAQTSNCPRQEEKLTFLVLYLSWTDCNLLPSGSGSMFAIICHMATVLWVQAEMCNGSVHSNSTVFHLRSPLAHFHYPRGIQEVMASRAETLLAISSSLLRPPRLLFRNCVRLIECWKDLHGELQPHLFWVSDRYMMWSPRYTFEDLNTHLSRFISNWLDSWESK